MCPPCGSGVTWCDWCGRCGGHLFWRGALVEGGDDLFQQAHVEGLREVEQILHRRPRDGADGRGPPPGRHSQPESARHRARHTLAPRALCQRRLGEKREGGAYFRRRRVTFGEARGPLARSHPVIPTQSDRYKPPAAPGTLAPRPGEQRKLPRKAKGPPLPQLKSRWGPTPPIT